MRHHIEIGVQDFDSGTGVPVTAYSVTVDTDQDESDYHEHIADDVWPLCKCPRHMNAQTGEGTRLVLTPLLTLG